MQKPLDTFRRVTALRYALYAVLITLLQPVPVLGQVTGSAPLSPKIMLVESLGNTATLSWSAPSTYTDGTSIAVPVTYTIYAAAPGAPWKQVASALTVHTWTSAPLAVRGPVCYVVSAVVLGSESLGGSPAACEQVGPPAPPENPTALTLS